MAVALSPLWWLDKLYGELGARQTELTRMNAYYTGDHPLPFLTKAHDSKMRDEFRLLLEDSRSNFMRLVVDAVEERLSVKGFRLSASRDNAADAESWRMWQANGMDADAPTAVLEALIKGVSYLSVWEGTPFPTIAVEDPMQTIVGYEPGSNYRRRAAALKVWPDEWTGRMRANVYLPNGIYKYEATGKKDTSGHATTVGDESTFGARIPGGARSSSSKDDGALKWRELEAEFVENPLGIVPIVPLRNRPRLLVEGESEISDVCRVQNQINASLFMLALAGYFGAHRQRWAVGLKMYEKDGKPYEPFDVAIDRLWLAESSDVKFGEFSQTDLGGYINSIEQKVLHIAVTTRTPRHYLIEQGQSPSGDAIKSAESGLTRKARRKMQPFGEGFEEAIRLARMFAGESDVPTDSEIEWADPEIRTEAEITDAAVKKFQVQLITREQALEDLGYSPQQIARIVAALAIAPERQASPQLDPVPDDDGVAVV